MTDRSPDLDKEPAFIMDKVEDPLAFGGDQKELEQFRHNARGLEVETTKEVVAPLSDYAAARLQRATDLAEGRVNEAPTIGGSRDEYLAKLAERAKGQ